MLNSQQIIVFIPILEDLKMPANTMMVTKQLIKFATFDIIPTVYIDKMIWYFPDGEAFNLNFEMVNVESTLLLENIGFILWMIGLHILLILMHSLLYPIKNSCRFL